MTPVGFASGAEDDKKKPKKGTGKGKKRKPRLPRTLAGTLIKSENPTRLKQYAANLLAGMSKLEAAKDAGFPETVARNAKQKIEDPNRDYFTKLMDAFIPDELMAKKTREGLDATVVKIASFKGEITDVKEFADFPTRARYLEIAAEFKGRVQRGKGDVNLNMPVVLVHSIRRPTRGGGDNNGSPVIAG